MKKFLIATFVISIIALSLFMFSMWALVRFLYALHRTFATYTHFQKFIDTIRTLPIFNYIIPLIFFGILLGIIIILLWILIYIERTGNDRNSTD